MRLGSESRWGRRGGFTIIELLILTIIILMLAVVVLLPFLRKVRPASKRVACNANLRGIAQASLAYVADDPRERIVPEVGSLRRPEQLAYGYGGKAGRGTWGLESEWGNRGGMGSAQRPLNHVLYKRVPAMNPLDGGLPRAQWKADTELDLDLYRCPGELEFPGRHHRAWKKDGISSFDFYGTSFAANILFATDAEAAAQLVSISPYGQPLSKVSPPERDRRVGRERGAVRISRFSIHGDLCAGSEPRPLRLSSGRPRLAWPRLAVQRRLCRWARHVDLGRSSEGQARRSAGACVN